MDRYFQVAFFSSCSSSRIPSAATFASLTRRLSVTAFVESLGWKRSHLNSANCITVALESAAIILICFFSYKWSQYFLNGRSASTYLLNIFLWLGNQQDPSSSCAECQWHHRSRLVPNPTPQAQESWLQATALAKKKI